MKIDLANWFEIIATLIVIICWIIGKTKLTALLLAILSITVCVEFTSKYLRIKYDSTHNSDFITIKASMYSLFNIIKFCGFLWLIYFLIENKAQTRIYKYASCVIVLFVLANLCIGQGYKIYNNYSNAFGIIILEAVILYKLLEFKFSNLPKLEHTNILICLFTMLFYYAINLPFYVFFHQMFAEDKSRSVQIYRMINDSANYIFYTCLAIVAILYTLNYHSKQIT